MKESPAPELWLRHPFPHARVGKRFKINLGPDHSGALPGDLVQVPLCYGDVSVSQRVVRLLDDGCLLARPPSWFDPIRITFLVAIGVLPASWRR